MRGWDGAAHLSASETEKRAVGERLGAGGLGALPGDEPWRQWRTQGEGYRVTASRSFSSKETPSSVLELKKRRDQGTTVRARGHHSQEACQPDSPQSWAGTLARSPSSGLGRRRRSARARYSLSRGSGIRTRAPAWKAASTNRTCCGWGKVMLVAVVVPGQSRDGS